MDLLNSWRVLEKENTHLSELLLAKETLSFVFLDKKEGRKKARESEKRKREDQKRRETES